MMKLKLIGVLQDFGSPYASLYMDSNDNNMYVAIEQNSVEAGVFYYLVFEVTKSLIDSYFKRAVGLREMSKLSQSRYLWSRKKGTAGRFVDLGNDDVSYRITQDDTFDEFFCRQLKTIQYHIYRTL